MNANPIVGDEYSGLATLLANLIAKYADVLELEDDTEENQQPTALFTTANNRPILNIPQGSLTQASLLFLLQIYKRHDIMNMKILSKIIMNMFFLKGHTERKWRK